MASLEPVERGELELFRERVRDWGERGAGGWVAEEGGGYFSKGDEKEMRWESSSSISESLSSSGRGMAIAVRSDGSVVKSMAAESLGTLMLKRGGGSCESTSYMSKFCFGVGVGGVRTVEGGEEGKAVSIALFNTEARGGEAGGG